MIDSAYIPDPPHFSGSMEEKIAKERAYWRNIWVKGEAKHLRGETEATYPNPTTLAAAFYEKLREANRLRIELIHPDQNCKPAGALTARSKPSLVRRALSLWA